MSRLPLAEPQDLPPFLKTMHDGAGADDWSTRHCARAFAAHGLTADPSGVSDS